MNSFDCLKNLLIKQTCRSFAYKFETDSNYSSDDPTNIYTVKFLKLLHDSPADNIEKVLKSVLAKNKDTNEEFSVMEKRILLDFLKRVNDMKSPSAKQWTDLQHYLCFIYRYCMTSDPETEQEVLSPYFIEDMRKIVTNLMADDQIQLCFKLFSSVREYTMFAYKQHQKITTVEASIESLFYYYEAFLSATKNICKIFPELEKLLLNTYKLGWLDFNTSIFMYYFYETTYVQTMIQQFETMKDNVSVKVAGIYTVITELHKLWKSQINVMSLRFGSKCKVFDNKTMSGFKRVLTTNFWIDRATEEKSSESIQYFDYQLFTLVGDKTLDLPDAILDENGQCICEDCLLIKYISHLENSQNHINSESMKVSCRFCNQQIDLDDFQQHVNDRILDENPTCKNLSHINLFDTNENNFDLINDNDKLPIPKIACEPPSIFKNNLFDNEVATTKLEFQEFIRNRKQKCNQITNKTIRNFFRISDAINDTENFETAKINTEKEVEKKMNKSTKAESDSKNVDIKNHKSTNTSNKNMTTFPCGHSCKLEEELKSEFKKAYQETCDHHKESKKCDCTFCEVFGTSSHTHKTNETRNRLRIRLNQRNEKICDKTVVKNARNKINLTTAVNKNCINNTNNTSKNESITRKKSQNSRDVLTPTSSTDDSNISNPSLINDIHGLLNFIEGNTNVDKMVVLADKKAAKKARQRMKKDQEKQRIEDERKREEEKRKLEERIRNEELAAKQLAEKLKNKSDAKKNLNKKKKKQKSKDNESVETIPAMVTIKRVIENNNTIPTVTITLKGSTPDQDKLLYKLVNGQDKVDNSNDKIIDNKKNKKNKNQKDITKTVNLEVNSKNKKNKNKNDKNDANNVIMKELKVTLAVDSTMKNDLNKKQNLKNTDISKKAEGKKNKKNKEAELNIPMLKLPPGITITKVNGPMTDRNYKANNMDSSAYNSNNMPVSKSGVIVVDTEKLIKQSTAVGTNNKKNKKKKNKQKLEENVLNKQINKSSMVTLKNPIFQNIQSNKKEQELIPDLSGQCQQASIFKNENGMVTIRSSRLQQSLTNGIPLPNLLNDLKPVLGPDVSTTSFMSSCNLTDTSTSRISSFNAQEILSGLPGIEITKVDKNSNKNDFDNKNKICHHTAEVSIIPANTDKANLDKDDWHYDNVFTPKDILEDDMDADERELEAFKRFCQQSVPPERKEKVAHLNVKDIVLKKKNDKASG